MDSQRILFCIECSLRFYIIDNWLEPLDEGEAVADGEGDAAYAGVGGDVVIEGGDAECLEVVVGGGVGDFAVPQGVVGEDEASGDDAREQQLVVFDVVALVGVEKRHVKLSRQRREHFLGRADMERHALSSRDSGEMLAYEVLKLVVYLDGVQLCSRRQGLGDA